MDGIKLPRSGNPGENSTTLSENMTLCLTYLVKKLKAKAWGCATNVCLLKLINVLKALCKICFTAALEFHKIRF